jgi:hypothetical protein
MGIVCLILMDMMLHAGRYHVNAPFTYVTEITVKDSKLLSRKSRVSVV